MNIITCEKMFLRVDKYLYSWEIESENDHQKPEALLVGVICGLKEIFGFFEEEMEHIFLFLIQLIIFARLYKYLYSGWNPKGVLCNYCETMVSENPQTYNGFWNIPN